MEADAEFEGALIKERENICKKCLEETLSPIREVEEIANNFVKSVVTIQRDF